jgi:copper chaperone CopZ
MIRTTLKISGMMCGMCEAHINDAIRAAFPVRKVSSSHTKGETVILSEAPLDTKKLKQAVSATGYSIVSISEETAEMKGFFSGLFRR